MDKRKEKTKEIGQLQTWGLPADLKVTGKFYLKLKLEDEEYTSEVCWKVLGCLFSVDSLGRSQRIG